VVEVADPNDVENLRKNLLEDNLRGNTTCFRVEFEVPVPSVQQSSTPLDMEANSPRALQISLIVGRSIRSLDKLLVMMSCIG